VVEASLAGRIGSRAKKNMPGMGQRLTAKKQIAAGFRFSPLRISQVLCCHLFHSVSMFTCRSLPPPTVYTVCVTCPKSQLARWKKAAGRDRLTACRLLNFQIHTALFVGQRVNMICMWLSLAKCVLQFLLVSAEDNGSAHN
jgi:hypothetical protein